MRTTTILAFIISLLLQVGCPLALVLYYRRKTHASWELFAYGAIVFAVFQLFTWLPLSIYLDVVLGSRLSSGFWAFMWLLALALGTALAEEGGRWLGYRYLFPRGSFRLTWRNGVMYGLGQASLETVLFIAGLTFLTLIAYILLGQLEPQLVPQSGTTKASAAFGEALQTIRNTAWHQPLVIALERILSLPHQVAWALLVMQSLIFSERRWFLLAVLYHSSIAIIVPGLARLSNFAIAEAANVLLALASLWIIIRLRALSEGSGGES
ncbi:MAG: YhfC family glutamic-type intramembrane protease [Chloroflexota bacterium]|nr:YhfC family glutamic-type intramembrane protease [Chloroflexota bacterium]